VKIVPSKPKIFPDNYVAIELSKSDVDISQIYDKAVSGGFREQTNLHITIVGSEANDALNAKLDPLGAGDKENLLLKLDDLISKFSWDFTENEFFLIQKTGKFGTGGVEEKRSSIIQVIDMPDMEKFYNEFNKLAGQSIPTQFPHITLFTKGEREDPDYFGIPIPSIVEFEKISSEIK